MQSKSKTKTRLPRDARGLRKYKDLKQPESDTNKQLQFEKLIIEKTSIKVNRDSQFRVALTMQAVLLKVPESLSITALSLSQH